MTFPALSWILITPTPAPHVKEMKDAAMFYTNRVLKEYKGNKSREIETFPRKILERNFKEISFENFKEISFKNFRKFSKT